MKPSDVVEADTTEISYRFYWKFEKTRWLLKKYIVVSQQLLFEFFLFKFHFVISLLYFNCYHYQYQVKQTVSLYLKLCLRFLVWFYYFWKDKLVLIYIKTKFFYRKRWRSKDRILSIIIYNIYKSISKLSRELGKIWK